MGVCLRLDGFINDREMLGKQRRINIKQCLKYVSVCFGQHVAGVPQVSYDMTLCLFASSLSLSVFATSLCYSQTHTWALCTWSGWPSERGALPVPVQTRNHMCAHTHKRAHTTTSRRLDDKPASIAELNRTENIREPQVQRLQRDKKTFKECIECVSEDAARPWMLLKLELALQIANIYAKNNLHLKWKITVSSASSFNTLC